MPAARLSDVVIRVGPCALPGEVSVKYTRRVDGSTTEIGGLFVPASTEVEERWMTLIAGIAAARSGERS